MTSTAGGRERLLYGLIVGVYVAFAGALLMKLMLRLFTGQVLATLAPTSAKLAVVLAAMMGWVGVLVFVAALRFLLAPALTAATEADSVSYQPWTALHTALGWIAVLLIVVSLWGLPQSGFQSMALGTAYLQLLPTALLAYLALTYPKGQKNSEGLSYSQLTGGEGNLVRLVVDLVLWGLLVGLLAYQACASNLLHLFNLAHPAQSETFYLHGLRAGMLLALWLTPATAGGRAMMTVAFVIDWLGNLVVSDSFIPPLQLLFVWLAIAPFRSGEDGLRLALRVGFGLCLGRVVGRLLGALLLGQEGPPLLEPMTEVVLTLWLFPLAVQAHSPSDQAEPSS